MSAPRSASILVVEDDVAYGVSLESLLRLAGHRVRRATDGVEALRVLDDMGSDVDLVLCDLLLPRMTGFEVIKEVVGSGRDVKILAMTSVYSNAREVHALRGLGIAGYLHKSAPFDEVLFRVHGLLQPSAVNTRANPRVAVYVQVAIECGERTVSATTYNLSACGLYVRTSEPPEEGDVVPLVLELPTAEEPFSLLVEIVHRASPDAVKGTTYPAGFGGVFVSPSPLAQAALRHFVGLVREEELTGEPRPRAAVPAESRS